MAERRFDPKEVKRILRRAGEIQSPSSADAAHGPTLNQLQEAAAELGLSPDAVALAASELQDEPDSGWHKIWGGPTEIIRSETIDGRLVPDARAALAQRIRDITGLMGEVKFFGEGFEFGSSSKDTGDSFLLSVAPEGGRSRITVRANYQAAFAYYLFLMVPGVPFLLLVSRAREGSVGAGLGAIFFLAAMLAAYLSARWMVMRTVRRGRRTIETLLQSISRDMTASSVAPTMIEGEATPVEDEALRARLS